MPLALTLTQGEAPAVCAPAESGTDGVALGKHIVCWPTEEGRELNQNLWPALWLGHLLTLTHALHPPVFQACLLQIGCVQAHSKPSQMISFEFTSSGMDI